MSENSTSIAAHVAGEALELRDLLAGRLAELRRQLGVAGVDDDVHRHLAVGAVTRPAPAPVMARSIGRG